VDSRKLKLARWGRATMPFLLTCEPCAAPHSGTPAHHALFKRIKFLSRMNPDTQESVQFSKLFTYYPTYLQGHQHETNDTTGGEYGIVEYQRDESKGLAKGRKYYWRTSLSGRVDLTQIRSGRARLCPSGKIEL
jgi:hypothetical protein